MNAVVHTMQQRRARYSFQQVSKIAGGDKQVAKCFKSYANALPAQVQMNGLGQALAFIRSKQAKNNSAEEKAYRHLYSLVSGWLTKEQKVYQGNDVLSGIMNNDMHRYRQAQAETQALLVWVKQFARAEIQGEGDG